MKFNRENGLYEGNGKKIRSQLVNNRWVLLEIPANEEKTWMQRPNDLPTIFSIPTSECPSAAKAVEAWLKTRPFK